MLKPKHLTFEQAAATSIYPLSETPAAIQYMQDGQTRGKVVIKI